MRERLHLVGIGGIGMSALARILLAREIGVSGSDAQGSEITADLARRGATISIGHHAEVVEGASRVVRSDAVHDDNPELVKARSLGIPVIRRSQLLAELMQAHRGIAISGTHGKTTVTAMVGAVLVAAGLDPTVVVGGVYGPLGGNARVGKGEWFVTEACEAYESYLDLTPEIAVVTNIEPDHLDHHKTEAHLRASFAEFLARITPGGCAVLCADRPELREVSAGLNREMIAYGLSPEAQVRGTEAASDGLGGRCRLWVEGRDEGELAVGVPGVHNLLNALGAVAAALRAGASVKEARQALAEFRGAERRFQILGSPGGITVVDDYAHHPSEIAATIAAARTAFPGRRLVAVFQPHLYTRTRDFADGFAEALSEADLVALVRIYPAREAPLPGVTTSLIAEPLRERWELVRRSPPQADEGGKDVLCELAKEEVAICLAPRLRPGDVVLVMGAGDVTEAAHRLAEHLRASPEGQQEVAGE